MNVDLTMKIFHEILNSNNFRVNFNHGLSEPGRVEEEGEVEHEPPGNPLVQR